MIRKCIPCKAHDYQDKKYGLNMRVYTTDGPKKGGSAHCTVCGNRHKWDAPKK